MKTICKDNGNNTKGYFDKEYADFNSSYEAGGNKNIKDFIRRASYFYNRKAIAGRLDALLGLAGEDVCGKRVLEVGCGPGFYSIRLAKEKLAKVTAIDYSSGMIRTAENNARINGVNIDFISADFLEHDFKDKFDYVFATGVIEYVEKRRRLDFIKKMTDLTERFVIVSFPKKHVLHALVRKLWLSLFKKIKISFFTSADIEKLSSLCGLKEKERRDVGILWVIKFEKTQNE